MTIETSTLFFALAALAGSGLSTWLLIVLMRWAGAGQPIRDYGPKIHEHKRGTPTMGGVVILAVFLVILILAQLLQGLLDTKGLLLVGAALGFGLIGLLDDALKYLQQHAKGLAGRYKLLLQGLVSLGLLTGLRAAGALEPVVKIPFASSGWELPWAALIGLVFFTFLGTVNAWNLTDGLDGLAAGITLIVLAAYGVLTLGTGGRLFELIVIFGAVLVGFLWFNVHPARIFLGDTGSMALGGFVAALSVLTGTEPFLLFFAIVPVLEALSVIIQVASFRTFGRRVFKVSPLHHHFERAEGVDYPYWLPSVELPEWAITLMFWGLTTLGTLLGLLAYRSPL